MANMGVLVSSGKMGKSPCVGGIAYSTAEKNRYALLVEGALAKGTVAAAMAVDNAGQLYRNYKKQRDIADRSIKIAEAQHGQLSQVFWPREEEFLNEFSVPEAQEAAAVLGRRYAGRLTVPLAREFAKAFRDLKCNHPVRCSSSYKRVALQLVSTRHSAIGTAKALGFSLGHAEYLARADISTKRRMQALAWGRNLISQATSLYASAGKALAGVGQQYSASLGQSMNELVTHFDTFQTGRGGVAEAERLQEYYERQHFAAQAPQGRGSPYAPLQTTNAAGYQSSTQAAFSPLAPSHMIDSDMSEMTSSENNLSVHTPNLQDHVNNSDVGKHQVAHTGSMLWTLTSIGGIGYAEVDIDQYPLYHAGYESEGFSMGGFG